MMNLLSLKALSDTEINSLLRMAVTLEKNPQPGLLNGKVLGLLFMNPSVRTLASFQSAMARLGGSSFVITPGSSSWGMEWRAGVTMDGEAAEHLREAIPVLEQYADALGMRCFARGEDLKEDLAEPVLGTAVSCAEKPFINMESAMDHPCQALADWKTLDDRGVGKAGTRFVLTWADHPRPLPLAVPAATLDMAARRGMDVTVLAPEGFELPPILIDDARQAAEAAGGSVTQTADQDTALDGATVVYAKSWRATRPYGDVDADQVWRKRARATGWTIDEGWFETAQAGAGFMHCLPVRRNVVVADEVLDGPRSWVTHQASNRLYAQMSVLAHLLGEKTSGEE